MNTPGPRRAFVLAVTLLTASLALGCRNPGGEGQGQTHTPTTFDNQKSAQRTVPTPPTADQVDPSSPRAVLGGTSTVHATPGSPQH